MATKTLRIDLEVKVRDFTKAELAEEMEIAGLSEDEVSDSELDETDEFALAEVIVGMFHEEAVREAFAGSNMFVTFEGEPLVIAAEWVPERPKQAA